MFLSAAARSMAGMHTRTISIMFLLSCAGTASAPLRAMDGPETYQIYCVTCHDAGIPPERDVMSQMTPEQIFNSLDSGTMTRQATQMSRAEKQTIAAVI